MSGHAYFGANKDKIRHISLYKDGEFKKIRNAYLYKDGIYQRVWTGASIVTYYDGENIMGVEDVDEGADALHPPFSTAKEGYTLYGWKLAPNDKSRVEQKLGTGEPFSLYAYYVPNTLTVLTGSLSDWYYYHNINYSRTINPDYISGTTFLKLSREWSSEERNVSFYLALNEYQNADVSLQAKYMPNDTGNLSVGNAKFDGQQWSSWNTSGTVNGHTFTGVKGGNHSVYLYVISYNYYDQVNAVGVTNITLKNPIAWV